MLLHTPGKVFELSSCIEYRKLTKTETSVLAGMFKDIAFKNPLLADKELLKPSETPDHMNWETSTLYKLHGSNHFPIYTKEGTEHDALVSLSLKLSSVTQTNHKALLKLLGHIERKILVQIKKFSPAPKVSPSTIRHFT